MRNHCAFEQPAPRRDGLELGLASGSEKRGEHARESAARSKLAVLEGKCILIVEDEALLALTLADELSLLGCSSVGPFTTLGHAMQAVRDLEFDAAIVDVNLGGQFVYPVADELLARGVPFVFLTGYARSTLPERLQACPHLLKPYNPVLLERELSRLMRGR
jgi:CheY-like chemotaxis protein